MTRLQAIVVVTCLKGHSLSLAPPRTAIVDQEYKLSGGAGTAILYRFVSSKKIEKQHAGVVYFNLHATNLVNKFCNKKYITKAEIITFYNLVRQDNSK